MKTYVIIDEVNKSVLTKLENNDKVINFCELYNTRFKTIRIDTFEVFKLSKKILNEWAEASNQLLLNIFRVNSKFSLWWLIDHRNLFFDFTKVVNAYLIAEKINELISKGQNECIVLGKNKKIRFFLSNSDKKELPKLSINYYLNSVLILCFLIFGAVIRKLVFIFFYNKKLEKKDILITTGQEAWSDDEYTPLLRRFIYYLHGKKDFYMANYLDNTGPNIIKLIKQSKSKNSPIPLESCLTVSIIYQLCVNTFHLLSKYKQNIRKLSKIFEYDKYDFSRLFIPILSKYVSLHLPFYYYYSGLFNGFIQKSEIDILLHYPEAGFFGRIFNSVSKEHNIKTVGLQHGDIRIDHSAYSNLFNKFHPQNNFNDTNYCPRTDLTLVFSKDRKRLLVEKCFYPENSIEVVGNPAYDVYYENFMKFSKDEIISSLGFDKQRKTVVVLLRTGGVRYNNEQELIILNGIYSVLDKLDVNVLIKLHPGENDKLHKKVIRKLQNKERFVIKKNLDLGICFKLADIVVSSSSTALIDAVFFRKNTIAYDPYDKNILRVFFENGTIIKTKDKRELIHTIKMFFQKGDFADQQHENQNRLKQKIGLNIDGNTHLRIFDIIKRFDTNEKS